MCERFIPCCLSEEKKTTKNGNLDKITREFPNVKISLKRTRFLDADKLKEIVTSEIKRISEADFAS